MDKLRTYFSREIPKVDQVLNRETAALSPFVRPIAEHILQAGGKRLRPILCILMARALGLAKDKDIYPLAAALEFLHSATLLHDDILDNAEIRRGRTAAHVSFGVKQTILAGDVLLALANRLVSAYNIPQLMGSVSRAIMETAGGEILEVAKLGDPSLTRDEYFQIIVGKTAYLIRSSVECGAILAGCSEDEVREVADFGYNLGIAFQLVDDALDYSSSSKITGKPRGGDLREGKFTLPLILLLEGLEGREKEELQSTITNGTLKEGDVAAIHDRIQEMGYADQTRREAEEYLERAAEKVRRLDVSEEQELLMDVVTYVGMREK